MALMLSTNLGGFTTGGTLPGTGGASTSSSGWGGFWGALGSVANSTLGYLANKDALKTQRDIAKSSSGSGNDLLLQYLLGGGQSFAQPAQRVVGPQPGVFSGQPLTLGGNTQMAAPFVQQAGLAGPITPWGPNSLLQQTPVQQAGTGVMVRPGASTGGGGVIMAPSVFNQNTGYGFRAKSFFAVENPMTGNLSWFRNVGKPILFSGDLRVCKRVNKVASRARRASPRRTAAKRRR